MRAEGKGWDSACQQQSRELDQRSAVALGVSPRTEMACSLTQSDSEMSSLCLTVVKALATSTVYRRVGSRIPVKKTFSSLPVCSITWILYPP